LAASRAPQITQRLNLGIGNKARGQFAGKNKPQVVTAVGRELLGFFGEIAVQVEHKQMSNRTA
jgi:hypothetical protein